jgi:hypothetical protein
MENSPPPSREKIPSPPWGRGWTATALSSAVAGRVRGSLDLAKKRNAEILRFAQNDTNMKVIA